MTESSPTPSHFIFDGRLSRTGLFIWIVVSFILSGLAVEQLGLPQDMIIPLLLLLITPGLVRRAHDLGMSGASLFLLLIPLLNVLVVFVLLLAPAKTEINQWGIPAGMSEAAARGLPRAGDKAVEETETTAEPKKTPRKKPRPTATPTPPPPPRPIQAATTVPENSARAAAVTGERMDDILKTTTEFDFSFNLDDYSVESFLDRWNDDEDEGRKR